MEMGPPPTPRPLAQIPGSVHDIYSHLLYKFCIQNVQVGNIHFLVYEGIGGSKEDPLIKIPLKVGHHRQLKGGSFGVSLTGG